MKALEADNNEIEEVEKKIEGKDNSTDKKVEENNYNKGMVNT